ncbi:MAG: hypothetical protein ABW000_12545 [Actinoplanes sp.]
MRLGRVLAVTAAAALGVRLVRAKKARFLHPDGRSFDGDLAVWGTGEPTGAALIDHPGRHPVTVRISKGVGTAPGRRKQPRKGPMSFSARPRAVIPYGSTAGCASVT